MSFNLTTGFSIPDEPFTLIETPATLTSLYMTSNQAEFYDATPAWTSGCGGGMYNGTLVGTTNTNGFVRIFSDHSFTAYFAHTPVQVTLVRPADGCTFQFGLGQLMIVNGTWNEDDDHFFNANAIGVYGQPEPSSIVLLGTGLVLVARRFRQRR